MKTALRLATAVALLLPSIGEAQAASVRLSAFDVRAHDPGTLADRSWGRLDPSALPWNDALKAFFYVRPAEESWLASGAASVGQALAEQKVPGLDLSGQTAVSNELLKALLKPFASSSTFRFLRLEGTGISDAGLGTLKTLPGLKVLGLSDKVTDLGFIKLPLDKIEELSIGKARLTPAGLAALAKAKALKRLDLGAAKADASTFRAFLGLRLDQLSVNGSVDDGFAPALARLKTLGLLDLSRSKMTDKGVEAVKALPVLHTFFAPPSTGEKGLAAIGQMKSLIRLDLSGTRLNDDSMKYLESLPHLEELTLTGTGIGDAGIKHLAKLPKLRVLDLTGTAVSAAGLQELKASQSLEVVALPGNASLKVKDLKAFQTASRLRSIYVDGKPLTPAAIAYARGSQKMTTGLALSGSAPVHENDSLQVITLADAKPQTAFRFTGLRRIHEMESDLDHDMPAVETPRIEIHTDTQENFLGEITIDAGHPAKR